MIRASRYSDNCGKYPMTQPVAPDLLELLVCPLTRKPLRYDQATDELISDAAGLAFPVKDGVPVMLIDEARHLTND